VPPATRTASLTSSKDRAASRPGRSQHRRSRAWRPTPERPSGPPPPRIRARRPRKPTRPLRSAENPPGC
jgi:hypothetical protein